MTDETKVEPIPTAADTQAGAPLAPSADAGKPAGLPETELARLTDEVIGALKTVYDPEIRLLPLLRRTLSPGRALPARIPTALCQPEQQELSHNLKYMTCGRISKFESSRPSHAVWSLRRPWNPELA
jgi:hypothetical protein